MTSHSHPLLCSQQRPLFSMYILQQASTPFPKTISVGVPQITRNHFQTISSTRRSRFRILSLSTPQASSSSSFATPPASREEAILQVKTCLSSTLQKSLSKSILLPSRKLKKPKQPRFQVEIPVLDDSTDSLSQLAFDVFSDIMIRRNDSKRQILLLWHDLAAAEFACSVFVSCSDSIANSYLSSVDVGEFLGSADVIVFVAPGASALSKIRRICNDAFPKPAVILNPKWGFEDDTSLAGDLRSFVGSFNVLYSLLGLDVKGILSKRRGFVFRCVKDGVLPEKGGWAVFVEDDKNKAQMKVVTTFEKRPEIGDVENVLYNLMAATSPVTKSVKFLKDLASNLAGNKAN